MTQREISTRLLVFRLWDVLDWMGVDTRAFVGSDDDPWYLDDFISELGWCDRHLTYDDEGALLRVR